MATGRRAREVWPLFVVCAVAALVGALVAYWIGGGKRHAPPPSPTGGGEEIQTRVEEPAAVPEVPLERIDRLVALSEEEVCAIDGGALACSVDAGRTWREAGEVDARILAILRVADGRRVVVSDDGAIRTLDGDGTPILRRTLPASQGPGSHGELPQVVDAQARGGRMWLLAHRFDRPSDPMKLPRVIETAVFEVDADSIEQVVSTPGFWGDRLLPEGSDAGVTFASVDARAWRYTRGNHSFHRISDSRRFGADYGGIQVAVERWAERLDGPGRPARPASRVVVSRDGGERWEPAFHARGEALVDFRDAEVGIVVTRDEATAWLTTDGAASFEPVRRDDRLHEAVSVVHVGGRFLVATADARVLAIEP